MIAEIPLSELPEGSLRRVTHPPFDIVVANVGGEIFAIEDACPHSGRSLSGGALDGSCVICPGHGWRIALRSGEVLTEAGAGLRNPRYSVTIDSDRVLIHPARETGSSEEE